MAENTEQDIDAKLREYGMVFTKLLESDRFKDLLSTYFTFQQVVDEETKQIEVTVIENPPEVIAQRMRGSAPLLSARQARSHAETQKTIQVVSGGAAQAVLNQAKKNARRSKR
jgi:acyl CoA:acetate/3-ketoacid CoA transferase alpha subunit